MPNQRGGLALTGGLGTNTVVCFSRDLGFLCPSSSPSNSLSTRSSSFGVPLSMYSELVLLSSTV